jgi:lipopolysaccharide transport system ATP-binding protein
MSSVIIVENLGKKYLLNHQAGPGSYQTLREVLTSGVKDLGRRLSGQGPAEGAAAPEEFWALQGVSFEVQQGDRIGIIGRNCAGKSTLLKILSRITEPSTGSVRIRGRVASLLEVGTGFHPELTGRENVYLNGAILGMARSEIRKKFDAIVDFAEIEKFLDTPVKRYSSGMYVRLAFAVAAYLEPEILIVDEVLAVGDAQFQKKCLGKMEDVSTREGRTVLFVSHNLTAMQALCDRAIWLSQGRIAGSGSAHDVVNDYLCSGMNLETEKVWAAQEVSAGNRDIRLHAVRVVTAAGAADGFSVRTPLRLEFDYSLFLSGALFYLGVHVRTFTGQCVFVTTSVPELLGPGRYCSVCQIPGDLLNTEISTLHVYFVRDGSHVLLEVEHPVYFEIHDVPRPEGSWLGALPGVVRPLLQWETTLREQP